MTILFQRCLWDIPHRAEVRPCERQKTCVLQEQGLAPHLNRGSGDLRHPLRGGGRRAHPGDDRLEDETAGRGDRLLLRAQRSPLPISRMPKAISSQPFRTVPGKDDEPCRTALPDGEHADQRRKKEHIRRAQCHQDPARLLLNGFDT